VAKTLCEGHEKRTISEIEAQIRNSVCDTSDTYSEALRGEAMKRFCILIFVMIVAGGTSLKAQSHSVSADAKEGYTSIKTVLLKSAEKMPEENYSFRTTPEVRTYAEMIAHVADVQTALCAMAKGEQKKGNAKGKTSKAEVSAALKESFDYCDPIYDSMNDSEGAKVVKMFGHDQTKFGVLFFNIAHDNEMYGQMVAYMRIKGIVPPSSEHAM
jgi:DinB family protein